MKKDIGSTFSLPCGIVLGAISRTKSYSVEWKRLLNEEENQFTTISSCYHNDDRTPKQISDNCNSGFSFDDFSLTIHNFSLTDSDVSSVAQSVKFKCIVDQMFKPSFQPNTLSHRTADTLVAFTFGKTCREYNINNNYYV